MFDGQSFAPCLKYLFRLSETDDAVMEIVRAYFKSCLDAGLKEDDSVAFYCATAATTLMQQNFEPLRFHGETLSPSMFAASVLADPSIPKNRSCQSLCNRLLGKHVGICGACQLHNGYKNDMVLEEYRLLRSATESQESLQHISNALLCSDGKSLFRSVVDLAAQVTYARPVMAELNRRFFTTLYHSWGSFYGDGNLSDRLDTLKEPVIGALGRNSTTVSKLSKEYPRVLDAAWMELSSNILDAEPLSLPELDETISKIDLQHGHDWKKGTVKAPAAPSVATDSAPDMSLKEDMLHVIDESTSQSDPVVSGSDQLAGQSASQTTSNTQTESQTTTSENDVSKDANHESGNPENKSTAKTIQPSSDNATYALYDWKLPRVPEEHSGEILSFSENMPENVTAIRQYGLLPVEMVSLHDVPTFLLWSNPRKAFLYVPIKDAPQEFLSLIHDRKIVKVCCIPYILYSYCRLMGVLPENVFSLFSVGVILGEESAILPVDHFFSMPESVRSPGDISRVEYYAVRMPKYAALRATLQKMIRTDQLEEQLQLLQYRDEVLGWSLLKNTYLREPGILFDLASDGSFRFHPEYALNAKQPGFLITYLVESADMEVSHLHDLLLRGMVYFVRKRVHMHLGLQLVAFSEGKMIVFVTENSYDYFVSQIQLYFNRFAIVNGLPLHVYSDQTYLTPDRSVPISLVDTFPFLDQRAVDIPEVLDRYITADVRVEVDASHIKTPT